ncbi:MAG: ATP-binding cassette domain-containing protein, partial [Rhodospirillales bacterium]
MASLLDVRGLTKHFPVSRTLREVARGERPVVRAVEDVTFAMDQGESVGILGESGCGKTTTGRLLLKLVEASEGTITLDGYDVRALKGPDLKRFRRHAQLVFQNPFDALNPRFTLRRSIAEPLLNAGVPKGEWDDRIAAV